VTVATWMPCGSYSVVRSVGHRAELVAEAVAAKITTRPAALTRSLTRDQGAYTNGLLRQYPPRAVKCTTTPRPTSTPSPISSTDGFDRLSASRHHHKQAPAEVLR
jgi:hypothetical protein